MRRHVPILGYIALVLGTFACQPPTLPGTTLDEMSVEERYLAEYTFCAANFLMTSPPIVDFTNECYWLKKYQVCAAGWVTFDQINIIHYHRPNYQRHNNPAYLAKLAFHETCHKSGIIPEDEANLCRDRIIEESPCV